MQTAEAKTGIRLKNIVFATDFSPAATNALSYAGDLARRFGAKLHVVNAAEPVNYALPPQTWHGTDEARALETKKLQELLHASLPDVDHEIQVWEGTVGHVVSASVERVDADMVVLGTRGRTGVGKVLLGSSAEEVLRNAPCPVLTVGPHTHKPQAWQLNQIVYATDFSPASIWAARYAVALAREYKAGLTLLHVIEDRKVGELVHSSDLAASSERLLRNLAPEGVGLPEPKCEVRQGVPAEKILEAAEQTHADLIVLGARHPSGVPGAATHLPITTVHKVIVHAPCPVLTVGHRE
ncbi:MAG: universal stress protein [Candidatus Acidiferrales bacterium]|jgi:nucleotide-binding universal stress UspA family protein